MTTAWRCYRLPIDHQSTTDEGCDSLITQPSCRKSVDRVRCGAIRRTSATGPNELRPRIEAKFLSSRGSGLSLRLTEILLGQRGAGYYELSVERMARFCRGCKRSCSAKWRARPVSPVATAARSARQASDRGHSEFAGLRDGSPPANPLRRGSGRWGPASFRP